MDDSLKIIILAELDEEASAQRITKQLKDVEKLVNARSNVKIGVEINDGNIPAQMQQVTKQINSFTSKSIQFDFGTERVKELQSALKALQFPRETIDKFIQNIYAANAGVRSISTSFDNVRKVVTATISGVDRMGNLISQVQSASLGEKGSGITRNVISVTTDYEKLAQAEEKAAAAAKKAAEENAADVTRWRQSLSEIQSAWEGISRSVTQETHVTALTKEYEAVDSAIEQLSVNGERWGANTSASIKAQIDSLSALTKSYAQLEKAAAAAKKASEENAADVTRWTQALNMALISILILQPRGIWRARLPSVTAILSPPS